MHSLTLCCLGIAGKFYFADSESGSHENLPAADMQSALMETFFANVDRGNIPLFSFGAHDDYCKWRGVTCENGVVIEIKYSTIAYSSHGTNFQIEYAPNTVRVLELRMCRQEYQLQTRRLPRDCECIRFDSNRIYGTVDLRHLPDGMRVFRVEQNKITGPIELTMLPPRLEILDLSRNRIKQRVVYLENLPETLERITLDAVYGTNKIRSVEPLSDADAEIWESVRRRAVT